MKLKKKIDKKLKRSKSQTVVVDSSTFDTLCCSGYTSLDKNPEIMRACLTIAQLIGSITIHIMTNTDKGDERVINELSSKIDINPNRYMTRSTWMTAIVMNLLLYGSGNSVVKVHTHNGMLEDMEPVSAGRVSFVSFGDYGYKVLIDGIAYDPDEVLHFVFNPDKNYLFKGCGVKAQIKDIADNLKQAGATKKGFMESKWKPSLIVKVDASADEFSSKEGREKLIEEYLSTNEAGQPWILPFEQFEVKEIKPLSLNDLAISDAVEVDKRTIAALLGVPPFIVGVGNYNKEEWNAFVNNTVKPIVKGIEQEMTRKLIVSPKWYIRFNVLSLLDWDIKTIADVFGSLSDRGFVDGNEVRDRLGMSPRDGLDELRVLENYIPFDMSAYQKKLIQKGEE